LIKAIATLVAGSLLGGGVVYLLIDASRDSVSSRDPASFAQSVADLVPGREPIAQAEGVTIADSLAAYRAAAATDPADLGRALETAASAPWSPARDVEIDALLARLADLAPAEAPGLARSLGLGRRFVAETYVLWARTDPDAAIDGLAAIEGRAARHDVALALLDVIGDDGAGVDAVAAGLPEKERGPFRAEWIAARAEQDPYGAFREAASLTDTSLAGQALEQVAIAWAAQDPAGAIAQGDLLPGRLRSRYLANVVREWAHLDAPGYLSWLQSAVSPPDEAAMGIDLIAGSDPDLVMSIAQRMSGDIGRQARLMAMIAFADADPDAAMARAAALPTGPERESLLSAVGAAAARRDPDAALAWARSLSPPSQNLTTQIFIAIAGADPDRALDFLDNPPEGLDPRLFASLATSAIARNPEQAEAFADKLAAGASIQSANALKTLVGNWMRQDPEHALEWVLAHDGEIDASMLGSAARAMAGVDAAAAASYVGRIPPQYRSTWIAQVAQSYGFSDPDAALAWVAQFQGQEVYANALSSIITASARVDAKRAAQALAQASPDVQAGTAAAVAAALAREDPRFAMSWAGNLADERARQNAIGAVIPILADTDPDAAQALLERVTDAETRRGIQAQMDQRRPAR
jgi:hypothetical protein